MRIILHPSRCPNSVLRTCALAFCRCRAASPCAFSLSGGSRRLESRFFVCAGGAPGPVRCDDPALPSPSFSAAPSCRSVLPLRPAAPSCRPVLPPCSAPRPAALSCCPSYCPFLPLCLAALFCRSVLPSRPAVHLTAPSCRSVLPPCSALCPAVHLTAPFCRLVLPPHRPGSAGFARTAHAISSLFPRSGENPPAVKLRFCMT